MRRLLYHVVGLWLLAALTASPAQAGRSCKDTPPRAEAFQKGLQLALKTYTALAESGARVGVIGRVGVDLSAHGLRYSHAGFVWRDHPKGRWIVMHELNRCATAHSTLFDEALGNFFLDDPFAYEALLLIPSRDIQEQLVRLLSSAAPGQFHHPAYSMIANPWSTRYQNSNQWMLELLAAAFAPSGLVSTRAQAQSWLRQQGYTPSVVRVSAFQRVGATLLSANTQFDDHPLADRLAGHYHVVTVESVARFVTHLDPHSTQLVVRLD